ncbi:MAG: hypothetical protein J5I99_04730 [Verrucomicrobia bacterium]|nr:hypothetical protein [Kiritimatiellia bacterium]MCO6400519.1 hypothetical protein [Verrucomicrobiota bacterium]
MPMIALAEHLLQKARRQIRLREPQTCTIITGAKTERIDAEYDTGNRLIRLTIHTRQGSLSHRRKSSRRP